jgi:hypothetical protein
VLLAFARQGLQQAYMDLAVGSGMGAMEVLDTVVLVDTEEATAV